MKYTTKRNIQFSIFTIAVVIAFTGCSTNNNAFPSSGTYDADTFREKYDPDPNVDYSLQKKKKKKKLNLPSGTYDAATFRAKYDPDPNIDYGYGKGSSSSSSSSGFLAGIFNLGEGLLIAVANIEYPSNGVSSSGYNPTLNYDPDAGRVRNGHSAYEGYKRNVQRSNRANANTGYQGSSRQKYKYDLSNPVDRFNYSGDLAAQHRDSTNLNVQMDRGMGQHGGGAYSD